MTADQLNGLGYFYSTMAQSTAALIALFSVFATFRIQYSNMQKEGALRSLRDYIKLKCIDSRGERGYGYVNHDVQCWLDKDISAHLREIIYKGNTEGKPLPLGFIDYYLFINEIENFTKYLIKHLMKNMWALGLFLIFNIIALPSLTYGWPFWNNSFVIWGTILFSIFMIRSVIVYTQDSLEGPDFIPLNNSDTNKSDSAKFSTEEIEGIIKTVMERRDVDKKRIDSFKAWL